MINFQISQSSSSSSAPILSQSNATPRLTINHDVAADLDSSNAFEGPEKLLEVWFAPSPDALPAGAQPLGLKAVPAANWEIMLDMVNCKVLSVVRSDTVDAYLLSESSMFVFPHKIILKTCGTTTLLLGLHRLLRTAVVDGGFPTQNGAPLDDIRAAATPYRVFYSRKNFLFPDRQHGPHRSWKQEVKYLDDMFEGGSAYMVGKMNGDHWYLYITSPNASILTPPRTPPQDATAGTANANRETTATKIPTALHPHQQQKQQKQQQQQQLSGEEDETLEILMTDLDPELAKQFYLSHASAVACSQDTAHEGLGGLGNDSNSYSSASSIFDVDDINTHANSNAGGPDDQAMLDETLTTEGHALGTVVSDTCGLSEVYPKSKYPDARIDAYMFAPCGFSANGVVPAPAVPEQGMSGNSSSAHYFTVHVTPEPHCSFASFETNVPGGQKGRETSDIIEHVVGIFRPGRFSVTLFEGKGQRSQRERDDSPPLDEGDWGTQPIGSRKLRIDRIPGYKRIDRIVHDFDDYDLIFRYYEREGWVGDGVARVGEDL